MIPTYNVKIIQKVNLDKLLFPPENLMSEGYYSDDFELVSNDDYVDLRGYNWSEYQYVYNIEKKIVNFLSTKAKNQKQFEKLIEDMYDKNSRHIDELNRLDVGVASLVCALSACGCAPLTSCSAHAGSSYPRSPNIVFYSSKDAAEKLLNLTKQSTAGLLNQLTDEGYGGLMIYANNIVDLMDFGQTLYSNKHTFKDFS